jgi:lipopolysaccharide/colanic/teichoic acid biosynthesis glycosyltransferase
MVYHDVADRLPVSVCSVMDDGLLFFTTQEEPLEDPFNRVLKRGFDLLIAAPVVLLVLPPLCAVVAVFQALQAPGPLFFARPRGGQRGSTFPMLKFRSMYARPRDRALEARQATADDPRIYRFGVFAQNQLG